MERKVVIALVLASLSVMAFAAFSGIGDTAEDSYAATRLGVSNKIVIDTPLPEAPQTLPYYKVLGEEHELEHSPDLMNAQKSLPSEDDALGIAKEYLSLHGGLPDGAILENVDVVTLKKIDSDNSTVVDEKPLMTEMTYRRLLGGMPVVGPGDTITISMGENGKILYFLKSWRALEEIGEMNIVNATEATARLQKGETIRTHVGPISEFVVQNITLGYYSNASGAKQEFYEPVWIFQGMDGKGNDMNMAVRANTP